MNIQNRINKIKDEFKSNAALRAEWETVVQSESYSKICELVYLEATVRAAQSSPIAEHDAMAARKLFKLQAVQDFPEPQPPCQKHHQQQQDHRKAAFFP